MKKKRLYSTKYKAADRSEHDAIALTDREMDIALLLNEGLVEKEIADRVHIALSTVKWHKANLFFKADVHNTPSLLKKLRDSGILL